jgi:hypothetical protein
MSVRAQWGAFWVAGLVALASDVAWMILSTLYENGIAAITTPFLSFLGVVFFSLYLRKSPWAYRYSPHYAVGTGAVMALFVGESSEFYGRYAVPMNLVEIGVLASSAALLSVYFLPAIRLHFRAVQTHKPMEPTQ